MKYLILLTALFSSVALALDPVLKSQSNGNCYYDDGSVLKSWTCPFRLKTNTSKRGKDLSNNSNSALSDSLKRRAEFGKKTTDSISNRANSRIFDKALQKKADADTLKKKALADYVAKKYGKEGEDIRGLIMSGLVDASNFKAFLDDSVTQQRITKFKAD